MKPIKPPIQLFGTVLSFDITKGFGSIKPEAGGEALRFENSAIRWGRTDSPKADQRLSYELSASADGKPCAINLNSVPGIFH
jgi:CspA family cold shock protein